MKASLPILLTLIVFACTKPNPADMVIKKKFCTNLIMQNENIMTRMEEEVRHNLERAEFYGPQLKIDSLRRSCLKSETHSNLVMYADSVYKLFTNFGLQDKLLGDEMARNKSEVLSAGDSASVLNLLFWSLTAELAVHQEALETIALGCWLASPGPLYINHTTFHTGDTVMVSIHLPYTSDNWQVHFDDVTCINSKTKNTFTPKIHLTGPIAFLTYVPKEEGDYIIKGRVKISYSDNGNFESRFAVEQRFKVEAN